MAANSKRVRECTANWQWKAKSGPSGFSFQQCPLCHTKAHSTPTVCICEVAIAIGTPTDYPAILAREACWWSTGHCRPTVHSAVEKAALLFRFLQRYSRSFIQPKQSGTCTLWSLATRLYTCRDRPGRKSQGPRNAPPFCEWWLPPSGHKHTDYPDLAALHQSSVEQKRHQTSEKPLDQLIYKNSNCHKIRRRKTMLPTLRYAFQYSPLKPLQHSAQSSFFFFSEKRKTDTQ